MNVNSTVTEKEPGASTLALSRLISVSVAMLKYYAGMLDFSPVGVYSMYWT